MIRFVIRRKILDRGNGLVSQRLETMDAECPELERVLLGGSTGMESYDYREILGLEVLPAAKALDSGLHSTQGDAVLTPNVAQFAE